VSPVRYELVFYIPEDYILHIHGCDSLKSFSVFVATLSIFSLCMVFIGNSMGHGREVATRLRLVPRSR
jgi:hypothetical protein